MGTLNRRQTLIGLGALAGGTGAIVASGAFTSVEAQRDVEIQTAGDADALLELRPAGSGTIVQQDDNEDGLLFFEVENGGTGINRQARTTFRPAFSVTNNGSNHVGFYVEEDGTDINSNGILDFQDHEDGSSIVGTAPNDGVSIQPNGSETVEIDLVIDLIDHNWQDLEDIDTVVLVAEAVD